MFEASFEPWCSSPLPCSRSRTSSSLVFLRPKHLRASSFGGLSHPLEECHHRFPSLGPPLLHPNSGKCVLPLLLNEHFLPPTLRIPWVAFFYHRSIAGWSSKVNFKFLLGRGQHRTTINEGPCGLILDVACGVPSFSQYLPVVDVHSRCRRLVNEDEFCRFSDHRLIKCPLLRNGCYFAMTN